MINAEMDMTGFNRTMADVHDALIGAGQEADARMLVLGEGKRLCRQIVRFTPPQTKEQGEFAVERELNSLISEAEQQTIDRIALEEGTEDVKGYITRKDGSLEEINWEHVLTAENESKLAELHWSYKDRRGKVKSRKQVSGQWDARIVVPKGNKRPYIDRIKQHVGRWKASWGALAERLGLRLEPWVAKHLPSPMAIADIEGMQQGTFPVITMGSRAPGVGAQRHNIAEALRVRLESMKRRAILIWSGYNKDLANNMRIQSKLARESYDESNPENEYGSSGISY